ncbi:MAG: hypothetical protein FJ295_17495 [Planctomycetes bacterium]|nr:hypothetical protein [Planctomycetota bacterium]
MPDWEQADLPEAAPVSWRHWTRLIGPGIVMMGIQIGGGEWLVGPEVTAQYGGGLMWIATVAIVLQVFYNLECGRYALYCGEPVVTGFMRLPTGPGMMVGLILMLNIGAFIPALSSQGAATLAAIYLDRPPTPDDRGLVMGLAYACLFGVSLPVLIGGKVYNMLQAVMTAKIFFVLGFCVLIGLFYVPADKWWMIFSGFLKFGHVPSTITAPEDVARGGKSLVNVFSYWWEHGAFPAIALGNIAILGSFAGYAGGGGLANSTYSNFVRDKGWGMGSRVGAIASAVGGKQVSLSHVGKVFPITADNLRRWAGWWRYILRDQIMIWGPGCFMGMALPALLSIEFAGHSELYQAENKLDWAQAMITADGLRNAPQFGPAVGRVLWLITLFAGLMVMLPSQMSIVDDFSRRWTDTIWTASRRVRERLRPNQIHWIYYAILAVYVLWSFLCAYAFTTPRLMVTVISNMNNVSIGLTSFFLVWLNHRLLPKPLRPRWYHTAGVLGCGLFYLGISALVFVTKVWPVILELIQG